jgi:diguanylate cyclase (GGDEF)-like protein/PAS domain S-box-containing protein
MNLLSTSLFAIQIIAAALSSASAAIVWRRRQTPGAIPLALLLLSVTAWNVASGLKDLAPNPAQFSFLAKLEIIGQVCAATLFLIFILEYTRQDYLLTERRVLLLWILPLFSVFLAFSNDLHHAFWLAAEPKLEAGRYVLSPGSFYPIYTAYYYLTRLAGTFLLILAILRYPATYRMQATYLLAGTIAIWLSDLLFLPYMPRVGSSWRAILDPISYTISGLIIGWGILRHKLFDLVPIARDMILENLLDGIVVLDSNNRIVDINLPARYLLKIGPKKPVVGLPLDDAVAHLPEVKQKLSKADMPFQDIYIPQPADLTLEIMSKPIFDRQGQVRGKMLTFHDISARIRSEAAMRRSEENLRIVFENAPFTIAVTTIKDGRILYINPAGLKLYNIDPAQLKDLYTRDFYQDTSSRKLLIDTLEKTGYADNIEMSMQTARKEPLWVAASGRAIVYNGENALLITLIDISERRRTLEELKQSRAQLKNIFENADAGIHLVDTSGSITFSNNRWAEMLGYEPEKLIGKNLSEFIFKSDIPYSRHLFESLIAQEIDHYKLELRYNRTDNNFFWGALSSVPIYDDRGEIQSIVNFISDITQKKQTESALRETERRFREILEKVYLFAVMLDTTGKITFCNEYLLDATNWSQKEVLGQNWFRFFLPEETASRDQEYTRAIQQGVLVSRHENEIITRDNKILLVAWSNILLRDTDGNVIGSASVGEDITERRRAQQSEREQRMFAEALYDTAAAITSTLNFEEVLDRILENLDSAVETDSANISLIERGKVRFVRAKGYNKFGISNDDILNLKFSVNSVKNLKEMYQSKQPVCIPDTRVYPGWKDVPTSRWIRSYIGAPIVVKEKVVGFINIDSATPGFFGSLQAERLRAFSLQAAISIENTSLYTKSLHELEERKRAQAKLWRANKKLKLQLAEIEALQVKLREQAIRDALTGLFNRRYLGEILPDTIEQCRRENLPLSLIMLDIDHFKAVNDAYGHQAGDLILQYIGKLLLEGNTATKIPCRYGGEEFAVVLCDTTLDQAQAYAENLRQEFSQYKLLIGENVVQATTSIGIAVLYTHGQNEHALLTAADNALYLAKQSGRNCVKIARQ